VEKNSAARSTTGSSEIKIHLGNVKIGKKQYTYPLYWQQNNGMLLAGQSGSGKSATASFYLAQLALQGVRLIVCDYDAPFENAETLSQRVSFLRPSFLFPPAITTEEILEYIEKLEQEHTLRLKNPERREPILFVIDEASLFFSEPEIKDNLKMFSRLLLQMRKVDIRAMIIGQEFSARFSTETMRFIRSAFREKMLHRLDQNNAGLLLGNMATTEINTTISRLPTGSIWYNGYTLQVPYLSEDQKKKIEKRIVHMYKEENEIVLNEGKVQFDSGVEEEKFLESMFLKYGKLAGIGMETREDLISFLYHRGYSPEFITSVVSGHRNKILEILDTMTRV
jgi:hypothetical protein